MELQMFQSQNSSSILGCGHRSVVRALAFHRCGQGSIPRLCVMCGLSLLLVLLLALRFSSLYKNQLSKFQFHLASVDK